MSLDIFVTQRNVPSVRISFLERFLYIPLLDPQVLVVVVVVVVLIVVVVGVVVVVVV